MRFCCHVEKQASEEDALLPLRDSRGRFGGTSRRAPARLGWYHSPGFKLQLQSCYNKPVVGIEELCSSVDPAVLNHPPATINEHTDNLHFNTTSSGIPSPVMSLWVLKP